jgi:hypothetical protein
VETSERGGRDHSFWLWWLTVTLVGCASGLDKASAQIEPGMSASAVQAILGQPQNRQFKGPSEAWQYCRTDYVGVGADKFVVVWFTNARATGVQTYQNKQGVGTCDNFFKTLSWESAPDATVEIRRR